MAAYRQAKRMQRGAKLGYRENSGLDTTTKFTIQDIPIGTTDFTLEWHGNSYGSDNGPNYFINKPGGGLSVGGIKDNNGIGFCGLGNIGATNWKADAIDEKFHMCLIRKGQTIKLYANNSLIVSKENVEIVDFGNSKIYLANSSDLGFFRVWNYALSTEEIATIYNNGDPTWYVVPKAKRGGLLAEYLPQNLMGQKERPLQVISENSYTWDNVTMGAPSLDIRTNPGIKTGVTYKVNLTVSGFSEGEPYLYAGSRVSIPAANGTYDLLVTPSGNYDYISVYGGTNIQLKNLTITVNKVEVANVATSWLDSAKQMPLSDEYMEPLFQSIGGYDMVANGAPEILYNE